MVTDRMNKKTYDGYKILYIILIVLLSILGGTFSGKLIATSVEYSVGNPYHFEKVVAEIVDTKFYRGRHGKYWLDYYRLIACYTDEETGLQYKAPLSRRIKDKNEAESYIGETAYILIDREYGRATAYNENAIKSDVPIDIIVFSVLLAFCLAILLLSIIKLTQKNKKHWLWIAVCILLMLGLTAWVAYGSIDFNYINALK